MIMVVRILTSLFEQYYSLNSATYVLLTIRLRNQSTVGVGIKPTFDSEVNLRATNDQKNT